MQHEMVSLERRITSLEDDELEVMAPLEDAQRDLDALTAQLAAADERLGRARARPATRSRAEIDAELAERRSAERATARRRTCPSDLLALYDKLRAQQGRRRRGRAAASGAAPAASSTIDTAELAVIKRAARATR